MPHVVQKQNNPSTNSHAHYGNHHASNGAVNIEFLNFKNATPGKKLRLATEHNISSVQEIVNDAQEKYDGFKRTRRSAILSITENELTIINEGLRKFLKLDFSYKSLTFKKVRDSKDLSALVKSTITLLEPFIRDQKVAELPKIKSLTILELLGDLKAFALNDIPSAHNHWQKALSILRPVKDPSDNSVAESPETDERLAEFEKRFSIKVHLAMVSTETDAVKKTRQELQKDINSIELTEHTVEVFLNLASLIARNYPYHPKVRQAKNIQEFKEFSEDVQKSMLTGRIFDSNHTASRIKSLSNKFLAMLESPLVPEETYEFASEYFRNTINNLNTRLNERIKEWLTEEIEHAINNHESAKQLGIRKAWASQTLKRWISSGFVSEKEAADLAAKLNSLELSPERTFDENITKASINAFRRQLVYMDFRTEDEMRLVDAAIRLVLAISKAENNSEGNNRIVGVKQCADALSNAILAAANNPQTLFFSKKLIFNELLVFSDNYLDHLAE